MTRDHSLIEELLAVEALDGLDSGDREALDRERGTHGECMECERLEMGFAEAAGRLGFALDPVPARDATADEILRKAGALGPAHPLTSVRTHERRERAQGRAMLAAAVAVVVLLGGIAIRTATHGGELTAAFSGQANVHLAMTYTPGESGGELDGSGLRDLPAGRVYELWAIRTGSPIRATCFSPNKGDVRVKLGIAVQAGDVMAVTVESASCPTAPTTTPVLSADLSKIS